MAPLLILVAVLAVVALAVAPLLLPWQRQVQWLVVSNFTPHPLGLPTAPSHLTLRAVTVECVNALPKGLVIRLGGVAKGEHLVLWGPTPDDVAACLQRWADDSAPLLLISTADGGTSLHSQTECVTGLRYWLASPLATSSTAS